MSQPEIVHPFPAEQLEAWMRTVATNLLHNADAPEHAGRLANRRRTWDPARGWGVVERDAVVGTLVTEHRTLTVPGPGTTTRVVDVDALTGVSVSATHRRRGLLRRMITESLAEAKERGDALSVLIAAEWPIYGRYGYAPATRVARLVYRPRTRGAAPVGVEAAGVRPATREELGQVAGPVFANARRDRAGQMDRDGVWWPRRFGLDGFFAAPADGVVWVVHESDGEVDGLLGWKVTRDFDLANNFGAADVVEFVAASDRAYRELWAYLAGVDAIEEFTLDNRPPDEPVRWLLGDGRALTQTALDDFLWVRLLDVSAALAARSYTTPGDLVLDVVDPDGAGFAAGRFRLTTDGPTAACASTGDKPDLRITQRALASAYLGGHRIAQLAAVGGVEELTPGALAAADLLFSTPLEPLTQTWF